MTEEQVHKMYADMVAGFKRQCEDSLKGQTAAWNELLQSGQKNFQDIQQHYAKGHQDLIAQMKKANTEMIEKLTKNYNDLRDQLQNSYKTLTVQSKTNFDKNIDLFKQNCEDAMKKVTALSPKSYQDTIRELQALQGKNAEAVSQSFKSMMDHLEKAFQDTVKQLRLPDTNAKSAAPPSGSRKKS